MPQDVKLLEAKMGAVQTPDTLEGTLKKYISALRNRRIP